MARWPHLRPQRCSGRATPETCRVWGGERPRFASLDTLSGSVCDPGSSRRLRRRTLGQIGSRPAMMGRSLRQGVVISVPVPTRCTLLVAAESGMDLVRLVAGGLDLLSSSSLPTWPESALDQRVMGGACALAEWRRKRWDAGEAASVVDPAGG